MSVLRNFVARVKEVGNEDGWGVAIRRGLKWIGLTLIYPYCVLSKPKTFKIGGKQLKYFNHFFNTTWMNERSLEVPIVWSEVEKKKEGDILEVGNVLPYYFSKFPKSYDIVDKYEKIKGVINEDIVDFKPSKKYDLIVSISTLEHVGVDEDPKDPEKIVCAVDNLRSLLKRGGKMVVTLPLDYHPKLFELLEKSKLKFTKEHYLKRVSLGNEWKEVSREKAKMLKYGYPYMYANGLFVGVIENK